jgi:hypothetical protein
VTTVKTWTGLETPLVEKGTNFRCYLNIWLNDSRLIIAPSWQPFLFYAFFVAFFSFCLGGVLQHHFEFEDEIYFVILSTISILMLPFMIKASDFQFFDYQNGMYKRYCFWPNSAKNSCLLSDVVCIQYVHKVWFDSDNSETESEEVNLILKNGSRLNIIEQGSLKHSNETVEFLSSLLKVPHIEVRANET